MENEEKVEPVYLKGFNEGYIIAQQMPELAEVLANVKGNSERLDGLKAGHQQYLKEQIEQIRTHLPHEPVKNQLPDWLRSDRSVKSNNSPTKSKGRDLEPDKD